MIFGESGKPIDILLIEDNPGDIRLTQEAFKEGKIRNNFYVVRDGVQALDFLFQRGEFNGMPRPDIILLDLNLPKKDGREVLEVIKVDETTRKIPVVILTTSKAEEDILKTYNLHANCFISKPVELEEFMRVVKSIEDFWLTVVRLPVN